MDLAEFMHANSHCQALNEEFALWKITNRTWDGQPIRLEQTHSMFFGVRGELTLRFDGKPYRIPQGGFADFPNLHPLELTEMTEETECYQLLSTEAFLSDLFKNRPPFPYTYILNRNEQPVSRFGPGEMRSLLHGIELLDRVLRDRTHYFRTEMVRYGFMLLCFEIANASLDLLGGCADEPDAGGKKRFFVRFVRMLQHVREEHSVNYYASQLCITPQYLNRIVREISHRTASEWIHTMLAGEIARMLETTDDSVQEIADRLGFADQATLTKFFKRQKGLSPTEYRRRQKSVSFPTP